MSDITTEKKLTVKELSERTGKCPAAIYKLCKKLGRMPTVEEVKNQKAGRPRKY